jgi:hypothetical protein
MFSLLRTRLAVRPLEDRTVPAGGFDHVFHVTNGTALAAAVQSADSKGGTSEINLDQAGLYNVSAALPISADIN